MKLLCTFARFSFCLRPFGLKVSHILLFKKKAVFAELLEHSRYIGFHLPSYNVHVFLINEKVL